MRLSWTVSYETIGPSAQDASDTADMRVTVKATRAQAELVYLFQQSKYKKSKRANNTNPFIHPPINSPKSLAMHHINIKFSQHRRGYVPRRSAR
mmetsp:Transcript_32972/g.97300  ORF Transcript_32972/g.97300 Transcript_32972/m.97300 type:complete len:94 (+) Transcript_32972:333-614(+)